MIGQRHRRVADLGREHLDQECRDRPVNHGHVDHHDDQDQFRHDPVDLGGIGFGRIAGSIEGCLPFRRIPALYLGRADRQIDGLRSRRAHRLDFGAVHFTRASPKDGRAGYCFARLSQLASGGAGKM